MPALVGALFLFMAANGMFVANMMAGALELHPDQAGATSALAGSIQFGSGVFATALLGWLADGTPRPMGTIIASVGIGAFIMVLLVTRPRRS